MPENTVHALLLWIAFALVFLAFGGLGAGVTTLLFELIFEESFSDALYAVIFGGLGFIAYQLVRHLAERRGGGRPRSG